MTNTLDKLERAKLINSELSEITNSLLEEALPLIEKAYFFWKEGVKIEGLFIDDFWGGAAFPKSFEIKDLIFSKILDKIYFKPRLFMEENILYPYLDVHIYKPVPFSFDIQLILDTSWIKLAEQNLVDLKKEKEWALLKTAACQEKRRQEIEANDLLYRKELYETLKKEFEG